MNIPAGLQVERTIAIESPEHLSDVLSQATAVGQAVLPIGGGTCLATSKPTEHSYLALDLSPLAGIVDYIPTDMTAGFLAGTSIREVRDTLAANGQELPIDLPMDDAGTIGGLIATGFAGPRRYGQGTLKDLLIGSEYVRGDGLVAKAGGMTVKNVSGYEISRMLHGSWGSLAVMTRLNLKVVPKSRIDRTIVWSDVDVQGALERQTLLLAEFPGLVALQSVQVENAWQTGVRFAGRESAVNEYAQAAIDRHGSPHESDDPMGFWASRMGVESAPRMVVSGNVEQVRDTALDMSSIEGVSNLAISLGTGDMSAELDPDRIDVAHLPTPQSSLWMIEGGTADWKREMPIWGPQRDDRYVAESIKQQFDPGGILNRGRLFV